jgi:hypothetical protein
MLDAHFLFQASGVTDNFQHRTFQINKDNTRRIYRVLTMVFDNQFHWAYEFRSTSGILNEQETQRFGNWIFFPLHVRGEKQLLCWCLRKS